MTYSVHVCVECGREGASFNDNVGYDWHPECYASWRRHNRAKRGLSMLWYVLFGAAMLLGIVKFVVPFFRAMLH